MKSLFSLACLVLSVILLPIHASAAGEPPRIPVCMIVDDPTPFMNPRWVKDKTVCPIAGGQWSVCSPLGQSSRVGRKP